MSEPAALLGARGAARVPRILLVEDDRELAEMLAYALTQAQFVAVVARDNPSALERFEQELPDLVVIDIALGAWNGLDLLKEIRRRSDVPVIVATGSATAEGDKIRALEMGADDYLIKPFGYLELIARIHAHLRRHREPTAPSERLEIGSITLDPVAHVTEKNGQPLQLTVIEFRLLQYLMTRAGSVVSTAELLREVWGYDDPGASDVLRVALHRLRRKIEDEPARPRYLSTIAGIGVILNPPTR
ncbi:MAG: response regulator transcription factor [Chloroflexi bacterium]|nr:MAG: response regulator transcription factor [Chloroflexota bacterium]